MRHSSVILAAVPALAVAAVWLAAPASTAAPQPVDLDPACADAPGDRFADVSGTHRDGIDCIGWWGVTAGVGGGQYDPEGSVTRGQMATFLAATLDVTAGELPTDAADAFGDDDGSHHERAIDQLAALGVVAGVGSERYAPADPVTRGQMATFLAATWAARTGEPLPAGADAFSDDDGSVHEDSIDAVAAAGLTGGSEDGDYVPGGDVTRAQMGTFLARLLARLVSASHVTYPPADPVPLPEVAGCAADGGDLRVSGEQGSRWHERELDAGTVIDAGGAVWDAVGDDPVRVGGGRGICWQGGEIDGGYGPGFTWDDAHETAAFSLYGAEMVVTDLRIHNEGDLINLKEEARDFRLSRLHLSHGRDDCIENDYVHSGVLEDSLLDGCYTVLSASPSSDRDDTGVDNEWIVRRSLLRLEPMEQVYKGDAPGHGRFFKWGDGEQAVGISLHDNVFLVEQPPNGGDLSLPEEHLRSCSDNVMVWLGEGEFPGWLPEECFTLTRDRTVWDDAVAAWHREHGQG